MSEKVISPVDNPLITVTDDCDPQLPPVPISIGIYAVRTMQADKRFSKEEIIRLVNVEDIISIKSHGNLAFQIENTDC